LVGRNVRVHGLNDTGLLSPVKRKGRFFLRFPHRGGAEAARQTVGTPPTGAYGTLVTAGTKPPGSGNDSSHARW